MNCIIHLLGRGETRSASGVFDGTSLCQDCLTGILNQAEWVRLDAHNRFNVLASIHALRERYASAP